MTAPKFAGNTQDSPELAQNKWVVLGACFTINFISSAFFRNAALFYPSIMGTFLVTRERAALPLFVYGGCFHLGALLGGTVIQVLTVWAAAVAGGILLSTTFIASSFVNGTAFLTAVLGVIGGLFRDMGGFYDDLFFIMAGAMMVSFALFAGHSVIKTIGQKKLTISQ
nr:uncharacterized protein LOC119167556 isoform X2 [Rhipicephalus microplus]